MVQHVVDVLPESFRTYYEPFLGGGAVFFELARRKAFKKAVLADANAELIACYTAIRDDVDGVLEELSRPEYEYDKKKYLAMRARTSAGPIRDAARFVYLNRTCFNGLYRVNRSGGFNVPFGKYSNPTIRDERTLRAASEALSGVTLLCCDFETTLKGIRKGDAVYIDPPYAPTSNTSNFTSYTESGFSEEDHRRLAARFAKLAWSNISVVLSNSSVPLTAELYGKWEPVSFSGARNIGGPASYRGSATEILVTANVRTPPIK
jgi:DNA adenine methylase